jgi:nitric oxide reductase subunit B
LLPIGLIQAYSAIEYGTWYARSSELMQTSLMQNLRWLRVFGDVVFAVGVIALGLFVFNLFTSYRLRVKISEDEKIKGKDLGALAAR